MADIIEQGTWRWLGDRRCNSYVKQIQKNTPATFLPNPNAEDRVWWNSVAKGRFTVKSAVKELSKGRATVPWHHLVWFKQTTPRYSFMLWILCKQKLQTKDRMAR